MCGGEVLVAGERRSQRSACPHCHSTRSATEDIQKAHCRGVDADSLERIEIHQSHFDVFDATLAERM